LYTISYIQLRIEAGALFFLIVFSELYRQKFDEAGAKSEDIKTMDDLRRLPIFMTKDDERKSAEESLQKYGHPFGLHLCTPVEGLYLTGAQGRDT
jgi:phenylacetate-CoA ligase